MKIIKEWYFRDGFIQFLLGNAFFDADIRRYMFGDTVAILVFMWSMMLLAIIPGILAFIEIIVNRFN